MTADILIVDDDPGTIQLMARVLSGIGRLRFALGGSDALWIMRERAPDLVLLDAEMPDMSGFEICAIMKRDPVLRDIPVIFVTSHDSAEFELSGFEHGAADFIAKPVREALLLARVKTQLRVKQLTDELRLLSSTDGLTGVANRRRFDEALVDQWSRCQRGEELTLLLVDVDHFKLYNDHFGHLAGDLCLRDVAAVLMQACLRTADLVARFGGEEFGVVLPQTPRDRAHVVVRRIFEGLARAAIPHPTAPTSQTLTVSIGVASYDASSLGWPGTQGESYDPSVPPTGSTELILAADKALYVAKQRGRTRAYMLDIADRAHPERAHEFALPRAASIPRVA